MFNSYYFILSLLLLVLSGCNENDQDYSISEINKKSLVEIIITPSLGKIIEAKVVLRDAITGLEVTPAKNIENGVVHFFIDDNL